MPQIRWTDARPEDFPGPRPAVPEKITKNCQLLKQETAAYMRFALKCKLCKGEFLVKYREQSFDTMLDHLANVHGL